MSGGRAGGRGKGGRGRGSAYDGLQGRCSRRSRARATATTRTKTHSGAVSAQRRCNGATRKAQRCSMHHATQHSNVAACTVQRTTCDDTMRHEHAACKMQHTTHSVSHATRNARRAAAPHAECDKRHATGARPARRAEVDVADRFGSARACGPAALWLSGSAARPTPMLSVIPPGRPAAFCPFGYARGATWRRSVAAKRAYSTVERLGSAPADARPQRQLARMSIESTVRTG